LHKFIPSQGGSENASFNYFAESTILLFVSISLLVVSLRIVEFVSCLTVDAVSVLYDEPDPLQAAKPLINKIASIVFMADE